jgi:DHA3 family tetracycline resistance protein-like MFS transporter
MGDVFKHMHQVTHHHKELHLEARRAYIVYLVMTAVSSFFFTTAFTTSAIYRFQMAQLDPLQLVLVGTMLEASVFVFEIPTGIVADVVSRRLSVIIGFAMIGIGLIFEGSFPLFATILLAQLIWGTGFTFISGAKDAWLADELGEDRLPQVYLRGTQMAQTMAFIGIFTSVGLASLRLNLPFLVAGSGMLGLALLLLLLMPETGFTPTPPGERSSWQQFGHTLRSGWNVMGQRPLLLTMMAISLFYGLYSEGLDRLWEAHFLDNFTFPSLGQFDDIIWFGIINAGAMVVTVVLSELVRWRTKQMDHQTAVRLLLGQNGILVLGLLAFGLAGNFTLALAAYGTIYVVRHTGDAVYMAWINRGINPKVRATVLSTISQANAIGQVVGGPVIGAVATRLGLRAAMVAGALILSPVLGLYVRATGQEPHELSNKAELASTP